MYLSNDKLQTPKKKNISSLFQISVLSLIVLENYHLVKCRQIVHNLPI